MLKQLREQMHAADVTINRACAIVVSLLESHSQLDEGDVENLLHQIHCRLCDACAELEPKELHETIKQPDGELEERVSGLLNLSGMVKGVIDNRLNAYSEDRDVDRQLWSLMAFLNTNILSEIKKIKLGGE
ncbi:hypothetical protein ACEF96_004405 [Salmonella enterica]|nr:hypothetical protein [Salmonella enterica]